MLYIKENLDFSPQFEKMYKFNIKSIGKTSRKTLFIPVSYNFYIILDRNICGKFKDIISFPH